MDNGTGMKFSADNVVRFLLIFMVIANIAYAVVAWYFGTYFLMSFNALVAAGLTFFLVKDFRK